MRRLVASEFCGALIAELSVRQRARTRLLTIRRIERE